MSRDEMYAEFRELAGPENRAAWDELERRGFSLCYHFGYSNAAEILRGMNIALHGGFLYEWLRGRMGIKCE